MTVLAIVYLVGFAAVFAAAGAGSNNAVGAVAILTGLVGVALAIVALA
jgi:hypothetical protein